MTDKKWDNTNTGVLFKSDDLDRDGQPQYSGNLDVGGLEYWIDAKIRTSQKTGKKFFSLKVKLKEAKKPAAPMTREQRDVDMDADEIPGF